MSRQQLEAAHQLIKEKRYDEARAMLNRLDHPTARKWLAQLNRPEYQVQNDAAPSDHSTNPPSQYAEIKILTQKDKWFSAKFDPIRLEVALNAYAEQGWCVSTGASASFPGFFSDSREEMIVIMYRDNRTTHMEYKVLTQKDRWFSGKFNPETIEQALNAYAQQGWRVTYAVTASFPGFFSANREEIVIILERARQR